MAAGRRATVTLGEAEYDLTNFAHPGGQLAMFGVSNSSDPLGLMYQYHDGPLGNHFGRDALFHRLSLDYWWPGIYVCSVWVNIWGCGIGWELPSCRYFCT